MNLEKRNIMSDAESGDNRPMNKAISEKGVSNEGHNKNMNVLHIYRSGDRYSTAKFKGKV